MPSGGVRVRSGRPVDPNSLRSAGNTDNGEWTILPAEGRTDPAPRWPLLDQTQRERLFWAHYWAKPQAIIWEQQGQEVEVALLIRNIAQLELPGAPTNLGTLVRQQLDSLGLSVPGLRTNKWRIENVGTEADQNSRPTTSSASMAARGRLTVVPHDAIGA